MTGALHCELKINEVFVASTVLLLPSSVHRSKNRSRGCASDTADLGKDSPKLSLESLIGPIVCLPEICETQDEALRIKANSSRQSQSNCVSLGGGSRVEHQILNEWSPHLELHR